MSRTEQSFVDYVRVRVIAGNGGDGCMSFRREKHVPRGGPDGGDGGKGGDVWFEADPDLLTLLDVKMRPYIVAERGAHGLGKQMSGRGGDDKVVRLPLGTTISTVEGPIADLTEPGQRFLAAAAGDGGLGNQNFNTSVNQAPRKSTPGWPGQNRELFLELKLIAAVGLVGLPNAGKSTLLRHLTHATPRVAAYPFTTLHPNLGMMETGEFESITIADIPGLIEGASKGAGLGVRFLRHIERTRILVHLVAPDVATFVGETEEDEDPPDAETLELAAKFAADAYELVRAELASYSDVIGGKRQIVVISKIDLVPQAAREEFLKRLHAEGIDAIAISAEADLGLDALRERIAIELSELDEIESAEREEMSKAAAANEVKSEAKSEAGAEHADAEIPKHDQD